MRIGRPMMVMGKMCICTAMLLTVAVTLAGGVARAEVVVAERIVGVVNTEIILYTEVKDRAMMMGQPIDDSGPPEARRKATQALRQVLERMVDDALVLQQASELKLSVEKAEIDRAVEEVMKQNNLDTESMTGALTQQGYTMESYRKDLKKQLLRLKVINTAVRSRINITDEDVRGFYDQTVRRAGGHHTAHVRHALFAVPATADEQTLEGKRNAAARMVEEARAGKDFAVLAKTWSDDVVTRDKGGDLGWVNQDETLNEALSEVIFVMEPNDVRGPIRTERGFEVVQLIEKKDSDVRPYDEVREQLRQQLSMQQMEKASASWLTELRKKSHIDIRL